MGVNYKDIAVSAIIPQCNSCGICLCWAIELSEYLEWKGFWDNWECSDCNKNYKGAYENYKLKHIPFEGLKEIFANLLLSKNKS